MAGRVRKGDSGSRRLRHGRGLGGDPDPRRHRASATIWFQPTEAHDVPRQRWQLDLRIPPEVVEDRIAAAIEAGGELVDDTAAPAFWVVDRGRAQTSSQAANRSPGCAPPTRISRVAPRVFSPVVPTLS
jgi:Glyoxalase-like domain